MPNNNTGTSEEQGSARGFIERAREGLSDVERRLRRKMRLHPKPSPTSSNPEASRQEVSSGDRAA